MAKLSERVTIIADWNAGYREDTDGVENVRLDLDNAAAVCAAVEAFQAAEQEWAAALEDYSDGHEVRERNARHAVRAAKARLLEVNLG